VKQQMIEPVSGDLDAQLVHHREVAGGEATGMMHLLEHHGSVGAEQAAPLGHPPLEGPPGGVGEPTGIPRPEPLEQGLGLEPGFGVQPGFDFLPNLLKGIDPRAVVPSCLSSRGQPAILPILLRGLLIHVSHPCRGGERSSLAQPPPKFQNLSVCHHESLPGK
jgi:hypothetical protein